MCLSLMALYDYRKYQVQLRLNRQLVKPEEVDYRLFSFFGNLYSKIDKKLRDAGLTIDTDDFILYYIYFTVACLCLGVIFDQLAYFLGVVPLSMFVVSIVLETIKNNKRFKMEKAFGEFVSDIAVMLRTNANLGSVITMLSKNIRDVLLSREVEQIVRDIDTGESVEGALSNFKNRCAYSRIIGSWVDSIVFAYKTGASLVDVCENAAQKINQKLLRIEQIKQKTARLKTVVFASLGVMLFTILIFLQSSPDIKQSYTTPIGGFVLIIAISMMGATTYYMLRKVDAMTKS